MRKAVILVNNLRGENSYGSPERIDNGEAVESVNMVAHKEGIIRSRGGVKPIYDEFPFGFPIAHKVYKKTTGLVQELAMTDDLINTRLYQRVNGALSHFVKEFDVNIGTEQFNVTEHTFNNDDVVRLVNDGGALPGGTLADTNYYVVEKTDHAFKISETLGGTAVDITSAGTGIQKITLFDEVENTNKQFEGWVLRHKMANSNTYKGGLYQAVDKIIMGNGLATNAYWDGEYVDLFEPDEPRGWFFIEFEGRTLMAGDEANPANLAYAQPWDPDNPDILQWGGVGYAAGGIIAINRNDGQAITGLGIRDSKILIEKERSKYLMTFYEIDTSNPLIPKVVPFRRTLGTVAPRTVDEVDNDYISLAHDGFRAIGEDANYASLRASLISTPIKEFVENLNRLQQYYACGKFFDNKYYSAIPTNGSINNDYSPMFDLVARSWYPLSGILARFFFVWTDENGKEWLGIGSQTDKQLMILDPYQHFDGGPNSKVPYLKTWLSKLFHFDRPDDPKNPAKLTIGGMMPRRTVIEVTLWFDGVEEKYELGLKENDEGDTTFEVRRAGTDEISESAAAVIGASKIGEFVLGEEKGKDSVIWYKFIAEIPLQPESAFFETQIRFYNSEPDQPFQINWFKYEALVEDLDDQLASKFTSS